MVKESLPKDARVMSAILRDMGVMEYISSVLEDSKAISIHAKKKLIDAEDVRLAVDLLTRQNYTSPPSRDVLLETARTKNAVSLPVPKSSSGAMKLPPDRHCITACNFRLKSKAKTSRGKAASFNSKYASSNASQPPVFKIQVAPGLQLGNASSQSGSNKRKREDDNA
ncbi:Transcription initiation factor TFIID subunit 9 [Caligus rogercresseyi]|uniref:Transcription initiation factor TFIID subunit 9 n=1 Tax=Caligus rogercresseyi TaxID=217165 RepID=A0A7T8KLK3_CALRO|nr:Transcription initiation factor TFIID subunit 9 [Caligus rogercresseyi]